MGEYSYTTIAIEPGESPRIGVVLRGGESVSVLACLQGDAAQVAVTQEGVSVAFTPADWELVTAADVHTARELAEAFAAYAAKLEQLHAEHTADSGSDDSSGADTSECAA
ncbi:hypothetical protein [Actinomadura rupiterrae]|uniref:hypothetical protein n=1 Tax=Actinomadura rupiterrae TaxID=559627 RepID=UPI0020A45BBD|nr:hypothetical protein [Actinomadura rupiterrae]MCP2337194.1 hypothetical protein [Actinomadura rupiterrae]MCP2340583.1 hypothetical protein [Actinomadura rupiterrae]